MTSHIRRVCSGFHQSRLQAWVQQGSGLVSSFTGTTKSIFGGGEFDVERYTYQSPKGGRQISPLEKDARIILTATPGFAKLVSSKYAEGDRLHII